MSETKQLHVGVISDSDSQRAALTQTVLRYGYELTISTKPQHIDKATLHGVSVDIWLVDMQEEDDEDFLDLLLDHSEAPLLFGLDEAPEQGSRHFPRWERRVFLKIRDMIGEHKPVESLDNLNETIPAIPRVVLDLPAQISERHSNGIDLVCVLAASLGGPAAVKEFLDSLPKRFPVAFVLAQHIDERMQETLTHVLNRHNGIPAKVAQVGDKLRHGELLIAPVASEIDFGVNGEVIVRNMKWDGPYAPSIDQTLANITRRFGYRSGAIIFSGMGGDGSISGPMMQEAGGFLWAQNAESCACASQPDAMRATGAVTFSGNPQELAAHLVEHVKARLSVSA